MNTLKRIHRKRFETNFTNLKHYTKTLFSPFSLSIEKSSKESDTFTGNGVGCNRRLMFSVQRTEAPCLRVWGSAPRTSRVRHRSRSGGTVVARRHGRPGYEPSTFTLTLRNTVTCCRAREQATHGLSVGHVEWIWRTRLERRNTLIIHLFHFSGN